MERDYTLLRSKLKRWDVCAGKLEVAETSLALAANRQSNNTATSSMLSKSVDGRKLARPMT